MLDCSNIIRDALTYQLFAMRHGSATTSASCMSDGTLYVVTQQHNWAWMPGRLY
jgi:hypothetical protein